MKKEQELLIQKKSKAGHDTKSGKPTGQGYGAARKGPGVRGPIKKTQVKEEPREYKTVGK